MEASTGIKKFNKKFPKEAIIFEKPICPHCGVNLYIDTKSIRTNIFNIRFCCSKCDFECPIGHDEDNPERLFPIYDERIYNFLNEFGKNKRDIKIDFDPLKDL